VHLYTGTNNIHNWKPRYIQDIYRFLQSVQSTDVILQACSKSCSLAGGSLLCWWAIIQQAPLKMECLSAKSKQLKKKTEGIPFDSLQLWSRIYIARKLMAQIRWLNSKLHIWIHGVCVCVCIHIVCACTCGGRGSLYITCLDCYIMFVSCYVFYGYAVFQSVFIRVCIVLWLYPHLTSNGQLHATLYGRQS